MALVKVNRFELVRRNPGTIIAAYIKESKFVDPTVIRMIVAELIGRKQLELDHGPKLWRVIEKTGANYWVDDAGKAALGY